MFNWFKKKPLIEKAVLDIAANQFGDPPTQLAIRESVALKNRGDAHSGNGKLEEAAEGYRQAITHNPRNAEAYCNLGNTLKEQGRPDEALGYYLEALKIKPDYAEAHYKMGNALDALGRLDDAVASFRHAVEIKPDYAYAHSNLGSALKGLGQFDEAEKCFRRALEIEPELAGLHYNLGIILFDLGRLGDAAACFSRALELKPDYTDAHYNLGLMLKDLGKQDEAIESFHRALSFRPNHPESHCNLLFLHGYHASLSPGEYLSLARRWEQTCTSAQDRQLAHNRVFRRLPLSGRRLRVGYVSGDYFEHAVSYFIEQLFVRHDRARIELFAYSTNAHRDAVTARLQALADHWVSVVGISDAEVRDRIEADGIDVLIDLSGHTGHNRLGVFALRAAPVQAHYLGYFASTGLTEMDYLIGDDILTPPETDSHFSERVWRLPRIRASYEGKADAPLPGWHPARDGSVWMGSFNNLGKLTPETMGLWARILHALPEGKLLLKTKELADAGNRQRILHAMADHGIQPSRIELQDSSATRDWPAHMAYYDRLDIALDPVGAHGGYTTTSDALWMGVPVITLEGDRMASRMAASILNAIGHPEWIAHSKEEYLGRVVALARDVERRRELRSSQRNKMASSPLCDARGLAVSLENAYFEMFERWLAK